MRKPLQYYTIRIVFLYTTKEVAALTNKRVRSAWPLLRPLRKICLKQWKTVTHVTHLPLIVIPSLISDTTGVLSDCLARSEEHEMVRHESAEALGSIASPACFNVLKGYLKDDSRVSDEDFGFSARS